MSTALGFNGAATFRSRNVPTVHGSGADPSLQWGRDLSVAECFSVIRGRFFSAQLQWGRDLSVAE